MKKETLLIMAGLAVIIAGVTFAIWRFWPAGQNNEAMDNFARCLTDKGVVMYGSRYCPHCLDQKNLFGRSFKYVNYVECLDNQAKCLAAGISAVPAWISSAGQKTEGFLSLEELSNLSGCESPDNL